MTTKAKVSTAKAKAKAKPKQTLKQFRPKPYKMPVYVIQTVDIESEVDGEVVISQIKKLEKTDGWIEMVGIYSKEWDTASRETREKLEDGDLDPNDESIKAVASCCRSWDEEFFDAEFSYDNVLAVLQDPELQFITRQCITTIQDNSFFFG